MGSTCSSTWGAPHRQFGNLQVIYNVRLCSAIACLQHYKSSHSLHSKGNGSWHVFGTGLLHSQEAVDAQDDLILCAAPEYLQLLCSFLREWEHFQNAMWLHVIRGRPSEAHYLWSIQEFSLFKSNYWVILTTVRVSPSAQAVCMTSDHTESYPKWEVALCCR